jgi:hypothetical protein
MWRAWGVNFFGSNDQSKLTNCFIVYVITNSITHGLLFTFLDQKQLALADKACLKQAALFSVRQRLHLTFTKFNCSFIVAVTSLPPHFIKFTGYDGGRQML